MSSNRIDFFQAEQIQMAVAAGRPAVFLDGRLCPFLEVAEIVRASSPEFGRAKLRYNQAAYPEGENVSPQRIETIAAMGKPVIIHQLYDGGIGEVEVASISIFEGQIEQIETRLDEDNESVEITARDFSAVLERICVYGGRVSTGNNDSRFLGGSDTVFNEDGQPNALKEPITYNGQSYTVFAADTSCADYWSCAEVIIYLLSEHLVLGRLQIPDIRQLEAITNNHIVRDLDVTGLPLSKALQRCCDLVGVKFKFVPLGNTTGPVQAIVFYHPGTGREVELNCQPGGQCLSLSKTNVSAVHNKKNYWPVTHRFIGQGDLKEYEATFDLVKAWDSSLEGRDYEEYSPLSNENFNEVRDVYRKWCLNEAGDYDGQAFDFSQIFETDEYVERKRRFLPALTADGSGSSLGYYLEASYDEGLNWQPYSQPFNVLLDECGVWLSGEQLDLDMWFAIVLDKLKFRITASVKSDQRLSWSDCRGPINSAVEVVDHIISMPRQFKYRKVSGKSIFHAAFSLSGQADDTSALIETVRLAAETSTAVIEEIDVRTPVISTAFQVGDKLSASPDSRDILGVALDGRSVFWIERAVMDFDGQSTSLRILRRRR